MGLRLWSSVVVVVLAACGHPGNTAPPPPRVMPDAAVVVAAPDAEIAGAACVADDNHCCMADGRLVVPGGCQPSYPDNVQPATERNADGSCLSIPCYKKCLPPTARIATPDGDRAIDALAVGDPVWSQGADGARVVAHVQIVRPVAVPRDHALVELTLADGRTVRASAGHPLAGNARGVGDLVVGDVLDGSTVTAARTIPYDVGETWDLLPDSPAGTYWADGVLLGSTIAR